MIEPCASMDGSDFYRLMHGNCVLRGIEPKHTSTNARCSPDAAKPWEFRLTIHGAGVECSYSAHGMTHREAVEGAWAMVGRYHPLADPLRASSRGEPSNG